MELFGLHPKLEHVSGPDQEALQRRHDELEEEDAAVAENF